MDRLDDQPPIISDRVIINGIMTPVTLSKDGRLRWSERGQRNLTVEKEVLGFVTDGPKIKIRTIVDSEDGICCVGSSGNLVRKDFVFQPLSEESQRLWCQKLREYIDSLGRPKSLFIFLNPYGGKKAAAKIFLDHVKPLLEDAEIQITVQETKHQLHAKEVAYALDLSKYDGIVCVSGDGILVEVVNGLLGREDWNTAIKMPLGIVPAGTGNGMAKSLLDSIGDPCRASNAVVSIIRGHKRSLDVATIKQGETRFFSILMLAWDFYGLQRIFHLRQYSGCVSFVPAPGFEAYGEPTTYQKHGYKGPDISLENLNWKAINGPFISIWLHNVPWGSEDAMAAPNAKFSDGYMDLIFIKECPTFSLLSMMTELSTGNHVKSPHVVCLKVKAFILEPGPRIRDPSKEGIIDSDGEVLARGKGTYNCDQKTLMAYDKLQITVDQALATLFTPV
ncbi:sphingosine kinase 1 [Quillaja saponaria]|uniref:sphingosine kinase n=1 Tax=Quillaja saponaria TaxID=32244 RepID=A0AAD7M1X1_QUISA|nr:sphingosine kinase 1 [Quillaja saponaria]